MNSVSGYDKNMKKFDEKNRKILKWALRESQRKKRKLSFYLKNKSFRKTKSDASSLA